MRGIRYLLIGALFGLFLVKGQVVSAEKIRAMFYFREPDLYLLIGSAVLTGMLGVQLLRKYVPKTLDGQPLVIPVKPATKGNYLGGFLFGMGWFIAGACPGPIFAQVGAGESMALFTFAGALLGTYAYARLRPRLPH
jgi:uncharacterized membrane protein YedE/YeeE